MAHRGELGRMVLPRPARRISRHQHALVRKQPGGGIEDVLVRPVGPGEAAVNSLLLPEARGFDADLGACQIGAVLADRRQLGRREVRRDPPEQVERQRAEAIIGVERLLARSEENAYAGIAAADRADRAVEPDLRPHPLVKGIGDAVHAADRLEHRRLHVEDILEHQRQPDRVAHGHDVLKPHSGDRPPGLAIAARQRIEARAPVRYIGAVGGETAVESDELAHVFLRAAGQFLVERAAVDRLGEQFAEAPAHVISELAVGEGPAAELRASGAVDVDHDLHRHAESAGIAEDGMMVMGDAGGAGVEIEARREAADLIGAPDLRDPVAAANRPRAAADPVPRLENGDVPAGAAELPGGDQPGDAGAEDHHPAPAARRARQLEGLRRRGRDVEQAHRLHAEQDRAVASDRTQPFEEAPSGDAHGESPCAQASPALRRRHLPVLRKAPGLRRRKGRRPDPRRRPAAGDKAA